MSNQNNQEYKEGMNPLMAWNTALVFVVFFLLLIYLVFFYENSLFGSKYCSSNLTVSDMSSESDLGKKINSESLENIKL